MSKVPCFFSINGKYLGDIDNKNTFEIDIIQKCEKILIDYHPTSESEKYIPYSSIIQSTNNLSCSNNNVKIIPFPDNHYDLYFSPFEYLSSTQTKNVFSKNLGKHYITVSNDNRSHISIFNNVSLVLNKNIECLNAINASTKKDLIIIEGVKSKDEYYILIFDTNKQEILLEDTVHSINQQENSIDTIKNIHDQSHHSLVQKLIIETKELQKYYVYEDNICTNPKAYELIPLDFLECLKVHDFAKAKTYLHHTLVNSQMSDMEDYFGKYNDIFLNRHYFKQDKLNYTLVGKNMKNYNFLMEEGRIKDIEEVF